MALKKVEQILKQEGLPATSHIDTETDYYLWWKDMVKKYPASEGNTTDFVLQDKNGVSILFDATPDKRKATTYFKDHIIAKKVEARHEYAANIEAIITQADEVWYNATEWKYLKYFNDGLYVVIVEKDNVVRAVTMYKVDAENYFKLRKGVLIK
ncbi:MAG: hypothetical protein IPP48_03310 [Chitinophagaceae bacterium]|nr:hypothetical protein [Chitinophagaceae bacterium]